MAPSPSPPPTDTPVVGIRGGAGLGDPYYPEAGNSGYDVLHYAITLHVDVDRNYIDGVTAIEAMALENLSAFNLDFHKLDMLVERAYTQPIAPLNRDQSSFCLYLLTN